MEFSSLEFLFRFLPIFLIIYYLVPVKYKNPVLFFGSLVFYAMGSWKDALLLLFSMSLNYILVLLMDHIRRKSSRNTMLVILLCYNIGLLCIFKYTRLSLPLGISFYTFTMLSYVLDVYKKKTAALRDYLEYGTYILLFPKLISGPIAQFANMAGQLKKHPIRLEKIEHGLTLFIIGLGYKVIIANHLAILWRDIQGIGFESISTPLAWMGAFGYSAQLFFDFQGYSLMAIGIGEMLGFDLPKNFDHPYRSRTVSEFYRRWHITLGRWFRDYLYIPLGGNRKGTLRKYLNILIVFAVSGLWHGASWNFVIWGLIHGLMLVIYNVFHQKCSRTEKSFSMRFRNIMATFLLVDLAWFFFRIPTLDMAIGIVKQMGRVLGDFSTTLTVLGEGDTHLLIIGLIILFVVDIVHSRGIQIRKWISTQEIWFRYVLYIGIICSCIYLGIHVTDMGNTQFIYFQF